MVAISYTARLPTLSATTSSQLKPFYHAIIKVLSNTGESLTICQILNIYIAIATHEPNITSCLLYDAMWGNSKLKYVSAWSSYLVKVKTHKQTDNYNQISYIWDVHATA